MPANLNFQVINFTIAAGASSILAIPGTFFHVLAATAAFDVHVDDAGAARGISEGLGWETAQDQPFNRLRLENPTAASIDLEIAIGFGRLRDNRVQFSGAIKTKAGGATFSYDGSVSIGTTAGVLLAANADRTRAIVRAGAADLWLGPDNTVAATGDPTVPAGAEIEVFHAGAIWGIRAAGTVDAGAYEEAE